MLGDAIVDLALCGCARLPAWGADVPVDSASLLPGGSCANTARQLGALGGKHLEVSLFATIGDDELGRWFRTALFAEGNLAHAHLVVCEHTPTSLCAVLSGAADRAMATCYSSVSQMRARIFAEMISATKWHALHLGGYCSCPGLHAPATLALCKQLRAGGTAISLDPQYINSGGDSAARDAHMLAMLDIVHVFLPNELEARQLVPSAGSVHVALDELAARHASTLIVIKRGAKGAIAALGDRRWIAAPAPVDAVTDPTGAGDAFNAGFLERYLANPGDIADALRVACAAVETSGACL